MFLLDEALSHSVCPLPHLFHVSSIFPTGVCLELCIFTQERVQWQLSGTQTALSVLPSLTLSSLLEKYVGLV